MHTLIAHSFDLTFSLINFKDMTTEITLFSPLDQFFCNRSTAKEGEFIYCMLFEHHNYFGDIQLLLASLSSCIFLLKFHVLASPSSCFP